MTRASQIAEDCVVKKPKSITPNTVVDEMMRKWPASVTVLLSYRMLCVGCPIGTFHTVAEACHEHCVDEARFLADLDATIRGER